MGSLDHLDLQVVSRNLLVTKSYCNQQLSGRGGSNASILRSTNSVSNGQPAFKFLTSKWGAEQGLLYEEIEWAVDPYAGARGSTFSDLFAAQINFKNEWFQSQQPSDEPPSGGRIFAFEIDGTLFDGAAEAETQGFLEAYNCPPVDTWFCLTNTRRRDYETRLLLAWIPKPFVSQVGDGIDVNPEECIGWFENWYPAEHEKLHASIS